MLSDAMVLFPLARKEETMTRERKRKREKKASY
jgi:hypothetical protein